MEGPSPNLFKQPGPILSLSPNNLNHVEDPADTGYISSLWHVFSKCAESIENGRRLENMSWRLWNRELFFADETDLASSTSSVPSIDSAPTLSTSGESSQSSTTSKRDLASRRLKTSASLDNTRTTPQNPNRQAKHLSSEQLQQLFGLFKPAEKEIEHWKRLRDQKKKTLHFPGTSVQHEQNPQLSHQSSNPSFGLPSRHNEACKNGPVSYTRGEKTEKSGTVTPAKPSPAAVTTGGAAVTSVTVGGGVPALDRSRPSRAASRPSLFERSTTRRSSPPAVSRLELSDDSDDFVSTDEDEDDYDSSPRQPRNLSLDSDEMSKSAGEQRHRPPQPLSAKHRTNTSTSIVRGFDPSNVSVSVINRSPTNNAYPKGAADKPASSSKSTSAPKPVVAAEGQYTRAKVPREKMFFIESSPSDSEDYGGDSLSTNGDKDVKPKRSSLFNSIKSSDLHNNKNNNTTKDSANQYNNHDQAVVDDDDDEWGNDSDWDSVDDESDSSFDDKSAFARDDRQKKPLVRPSLLSSLFLSDPALLQEQQNQQLLKLRKQKQPPPQSVGTKLHQAITSKPVNPTENLVNITATTHAPPPTAQMMSPRTTRRNMLSSELSESLRKNLLWERQRQPGKFSSTTSKSVKSARVDSEPLRNPPLRKSYTSANVPDLVSGNPNRNKSATDLLGTWREDLDETNMDFNYHARGW